MSPLLADNEFPPLSARVQVEFGGRTRGGRTGQPPADHFLILRLGRHQETLLTSLPSSDVPLPFNEFGYGMVVADGGGEAASRMAISMLVHLALHFGKWNVRVDADVAREVTARIERFYRQVDVVVGSHDSGAGRAEMHTSLTGLFSAGSDCFFAHVGHSRAYLFREGQLVRMTRDHSFQPHVRPAWSRLRPPIAHDLTHALTDVIGGPAGSLLVDIEHFELADRDALLVCSNGLTDILDDRRIQEVLRSRRTPDEHCQTLVDLALSHGGVDDVTAVLARYQIPS